MRRYTLLFLCLLLLLTAGCARQANTSETTETASSIPAADETQFAEPDVILTEPETQSAVETTTETTTEPPVTTTQPPVATSQPPLTTTQPPVTATQPTETGSTPFTAKSVRYSAEYNASATPTSYVLDSRSALDDLLNALQENVPPNGLQTDDFAAYTQEWFAAHRLIAITVQESSGSIRHDVQDIRYTEGGAEIRIERIKPDVMTCDIAHRLIMIELPDTRLRSGDPVRLIWSESSDH